MLNDIEKNRIIDDKKGNTENLPSLKISNEFFLTSENDFKNAVSEESELINELVKFENYIGLCEYDFTVLNKRCVAIEIGENHKMEHVIEVKLFTKIFKGIIVIYDPRIRRIGKCVQYKNESKFIDISKGCHFRTIPSENIEKKYVKISKPPPRTYAICIQEVQINCVKCMQIKKSILLGDSEKHYVILDDLKFIDNSSSIQYHNNVIIKPDSILKYEKIIDPLYKMNDNVRFKDSTETNYEGEVLCTGKVNDYGFAVIVSLENQLTDTMKQYILDEATMLTHFKVNKSAIFVGQFAIFKDVITYQKCKTSNLEVVDSKFPLPFLKEPYKEKILVFKLDKVFNAVILKWKGRIYNQLCMGCELSYESEEGSIGEYGNVKLFDCASKRGVLITSEKVNDQKITDFCEFTNVHKTLQFISTKHGIKIYDQTSICCIEKLDGIDLGNENLKIGCKIMYQETFIGICKFIGKVNSKSSVGIELNLDDINEIPVAFDFINFCVIEKGKLCFVDLETVYIGTFYKNEFLPEISDSYNRHLLNAMITYHPGNDPTKGFCGKVKWFGKHDNGNMVCGIELESEVMENSSNYFLENLFPYEHNHGIIDDDYKIEYKVCTETAGNSVLSQSSDDHSKNCEKIIRCILRGQAMEVINELIRYFSTDFIDFAKENKEIMFIPDNLKLIIHTLYEKNKIELINDILTSIENVNEIFSLLESLLSKCIEDRKFEFLSDILYKVKIFQINDNDNNQICLILAIKCLEEMNDDNKAEFQTKYESFVGLCGDHNCYIVDEYSKETFITKIILDNRISEDILIEVLNSGLFDINKLNSNEKSPMELAIDECRPNILEALFKLENLKTDKLKSICHNLIVNIKENLEKTDIIPLIQLQLDKMNSKTNSTCRPKEKEEPK